MEKYCTNCGNKLDENSNFCTNCGKKVNENATENDNSISNNRKKKFPTCAIVIIVIFAFILIIGLINSNNNSLENDTNSEEKDTQNEESNNTTNDEIKEDETKEDETKEDETNENEIKEDETKEDENIKSSEDDYKNSCITLTYNEMARNPDNYKGTHVKLIGKVIQVQESTSWFSDKKNLTLRVNVTKDEYGFYDDTVYVEYTYKKNESKVLEDDIITLYGEFAGDTTYTSIFGQSITLPKIEAKYININ